MRHAEKWTLGKEIFLNLQINGDTTKAAEQCGSVLSNLHFSAGEQGVRLFGINKVRHYICNVTLWPQW